MEAGALGQQNQDMGGTDIQLANIDGDEDLDAVVAKNGEIQSFSGFQNTVILNTGSFNFQVDGKARQLVD